MAKKPEDRYQRVEELREDLALVQRQIAPHPGRKWLVLAALLLAIVATAGVVYFRRLSREAWATTQALPQIAELTLKGDLITAFRLAEEAEKIIPRNAQLASRLAEISRRFSIVSTPAGADLEVRPYVSPNDGWMALGKTPIEKVRLPLGQFRWRFSKPGFAVTEIAAPITDQVRDLNVTLDPEGSISAGMVQVPSRVATIRFAELGTLGPFQLERFQIDKFEVTNREYKEFVDQGGYQKREYWKEPFVKDGRTLTWEEAIELFRDSTGRPGPASWEGGRYPDGRADYPVTAVSWYEAAAYAEFAKKSLPTITHWYTAADSYSSNYVVPRSNIGGKALARVGEFQGLGTYGTYDMAGNAKEWCWNEGTPGRHFVLGGSWSEPAHMFTNNSDTRPAFDRASDVGFRCVRYAGPLQPELLAPRTRAGRDYRNVKPVSEELFRAYLSVFTYDRVDTTAKIESVEETDEWKKEKITIAGAYDGGRVLVYLITPKNTQPPYQSVVYFPGAGASQVSSSAHLLGASHYLTLVRSGRAVLYPIFWGTYERQNNRALEPTPVARRERSLHWVRDLNRAIDYVENRPDLDKSKIGYLGFSQGAWVAPVLAVAEPRIRTLVLLSGGMTMVTHTPDVDPINFVPRVKVPVLMINGRYDFTYPFEASQTVLFRNLGSPPKDKRHVVYEEGHNISVMSGEMNQEMLGWLDRYLGKVR
jgi:formylglycine-generating enzyme required for sulfatase activity/dienelactone hydrolase